MSDNQESKRIHPLFAGAAVSVILASLVGVAAMTGLLPSSQSAAKTEAVAASAASMTAATATPASMPMTTNASPQQPAVANGGAVAGASGAAAIAQNTAPTTSPSSSTPEHQAPKICQTCGVVASIRAVEQEEAHSSGLGAVAGAVLGGVLGHQVGNGNGRTLATVAGAVGGGFAGNTVEKRTHTTTVYEVKVKLDNGHYKTFSSSTQPAYHEGDRVRVSHGSVVAD